MHYFSLPLESWATCNSPFCLFYSDCRSFKDKIEEITESLAKDSGDSESGDAAASLIEKLSVEGKDKEEKTEAKEEPSTTSEEKKDESEKQAKSEKEEN